MAKRREASAASMAMAGTTTTRTASSRDIEIGRMYNGALADGRSHSMPCTRKGCAWHHGAEPLKYEKDSNGYQVSENTR